MLGDRLALRRIVANIVDSALKYGKRAHLRVAVDIQNTVLAVDYEGPGTPRDQRDLLLEPFALADTSRARETGGAGLGLAFMRSLAAALGGHVEIDDAPIRGARVIVRLRLSAPGRTGPVATPRQGKFVRHVVAIGAGKPRRLTPRGFQLPETVSRSASCGVL